MWPLTFQKHLLYLKGKMYCILYFMKMENLLYDFNALIWVNRFMRFYTKKIFVSKISDSSTYKRHLHNYINCKINIILSMPGHLSSKSRDLSFRKVDTKSRRKTQQYWRRAKSKFNLIQHTLCKDVLHLSSHYGWIINK